MSEAEETVLTTELTQRRFGLVDFIRRLFKEKQLGAACAIVVVLLLLTALFVDLAWLGLPEVRIVPDGYNESHSGEQLQPPGSKYFLGTDNVGRDLLSRVVYGIRVSMIVGLGATGITAVLATLIGVSSAYLGGKFDIVVQRFVDAWMAIPAFILIILIIAIIGTGMPQVIIVLGALHGIGYSRMIRGAVIAVRENEYVRAARAVGSSTTHILFRHIIPHIMPVAIILFSMMMPLNIIAEATLSFLGLGIPPPTPSWGGMLAGSSRMYLFRAPWLAIWPGAALAITVFSINIFGDAVRDLLDPRLRGGVGRYGLAKKRAKRQLERVSEPTANRM